MIEVYFNQHTPVCDYCGKRLAGESSFRNAMIAMREAGWRSRKRDGEWIHVCNDCLFDEKGYAHEH